MIQSIHLKNFQSHKDTLVDFHPNLNIIVGENNSGKSAIFRALQKCIRNEPDGNSFISFQETETCITLQFETGTTLSRTVSNKGTAKGNTYKVNTEIFSGFGKEIPNEVLSNIPISLPVMFGDVEIDLNFGVQHQSLFLIAASGSIRNKVLGKIVGTDVIGRKQQNLNTIVQALKTDLKTLEKNITEEQSKLSTFPNFDEVSAKAEYIRQAILIVQEIENKVTQIKQKQQQLQTLYKRAKELQSGIVDSIVLLQLDTAIKNLTTKIQLLNPVKKAITNLNQFQHQLSKCIIPDIAIDITDKVTYLTKCINYYSKAKQLHIQLQSSKNHAVSVTQQEVVVNDDLQNTLHQIRNLKEQLKVCPVCQTPFEFK